jgi:HIUase/transthyretin family protein
MMSTLLDADDTVLDHGRTDGDGRIPALGGDSRQAFHITDASAEHHVPLPLSPFAYSTYRGS